MSDYKRVQVDPDKLIQSIKRRPMIYNKDDPHYYHNKKRKSLCWGEICKEVVPTWGQMKPQERVECCHEIQKRWKSLRTCFGREVSEQKREELRRQKNLPIKRRKVYGYFEDMSFLMPYFNVGGRPPKIIEQEELVDMENTDDDDDPLDSSIKTEMVFDRESRNDESIVLDSEAFQQIYDNTHNSDGKLIDYLKDVKKDEDDDDKQFLMSLVPTLKKFNDKQKFEAKIEILKVLKNISFTGVGGSTS